MQIKIYKNMILKKSGLSAIDSIFYFFSCFVLMFLYNLFFIDSFWDLQNYYDRYDVIKWYGEPRKVFGFIYYIKEEYFWYYLMVLGSYFDMPGRLFFYLITVFATISTLRIVQIFSTKSLNFYLASFFLLTNPLFIDLVGSQLRSALAIALFFQYLIASSNIKKTLLFLFAIGTHSSILIVFFVWFVFLCLEKLNFHARVFFLVAVVGSALFFLNYYYFVPVILDYMGDRRDIVSISGSSVKYALFWVLIMVFLIFYRVKIIGNDKFFAFVLFFVFLFFFLSLVNVYGSRYLAYVLPFVFLLLFSYAKNKTYLIFFMAVYQSIQLYFWL